MKMTKQFPISHLPDVPLRLIVDFLPFDDAVNFCGLRPEWSHLRPLIHKVVVNLDDLDDGGPGQPHFCPETYFDINIVNPRLISVAMQFRWKDQGWGNRKGQIWLRLIRNGVEIADARLTSNTRRTSRVENKIQ